ncbi:uncharacterized protein BCR38DRAFT_413783 [Pseudomassariella vexata]|uniref:Uncharacterized protein n=1 Tax=Pseudomassariella vexata TaxID=1141098 RepID=A0A1Y2DF19_9PEZI|nr:uncharacterized protein BCR38DRAFT_413783 [Pseudomassariella vexata]ORY57883.1 hypothetical protein BCR38DRAFT_413783 [Pseudomassariella vexata]
MPGLQHSGRESDYRHNRRAKISGCCGRSQIFLNWGIRNTKFSKDGFKRRPPTLYRSPDASRQVPTSLLTLQLQKERGGKQHQQLLSIQTNTDGQTREVKRNINSFIYNNAGLNPVLQSTNGRALSLSREHHSVTLVASCAPLYSRVDESWETDNMVPSKLKSPVEEQKYKNSFVEEPREEDWFNLVKRFNEDCKEDTRKKRYFPFYHFVLAMKRPLVPNKRKLCRGWSHYQRAK